MGYSKHKVEHIIQKTPSLSTDASGNTVLVGADGSSHKLIKADIPLIVSFGDSIFYYHYGTESITSLSYDEGTGLATANFSGAINVKQGDLIGVSSVTEGYEEYEVIETEVVSYTTTPSVMLTYRPQGIPTGPVSGTFNLSTRWNTSNRSVMAWAQFLTKHRFNHVGASQGGDTAADLVERFDRDVTPLNPDYVIVNFGTNDIYVSDRSVADMLADLATLRQKINSIGAKMIYLSNHPQDSTRALWSIAKVNKHHQWRSHARDYCAANGVAFIDWMSATANGMTVINAADANGNPNAGMLHSTDKIHPSRLGCYAAGKKLAAWLNHTLPEIDRLTSSNQTVDASNLLPGLFTGTGGSGADSGTVATGWTVSKTVSATVAASTPARTVAADGDAIGNNQVLEITSAGSGATVTISSADIDTLFSAGDIAEVLAHVQATNQADVTNIRMFVNTQSATTSNKFFYDFAYISTNAAAITDDLDGVMRCIVDLRTAANGAGAPTNFVVSFTVQFGTSGTGTCTLKLGRGTCYKKAA